MAGNGASVRQTPRSQAVAQSPLQDLPLHRSTNQCSRLPHPGHYLRLQPTEFTGAFHRESKQLHLIHKNKHREPAKLGKQRNKAQMKEQIKTPEKEQNKMEISNLSDAEFKTLVIRILKNLSEDLISIKQKQKQKQKTLVRNKVYTN